MDIKIGHPKIKMSAGVFSFYCSVCLCPSCKKNVKVSRFATTRRSQCEIIKTFVFREIVFYILARHSGLDTEYL